MSILSDTLFLKKEIENYNIKYTPCRMYTSRIALDLYAYEVEKIE